MVYLILNSYRYFNSGSTFFLKVFCLYLAVNYPSYFFSTHNSKHCYILLLHSSISFLVSFPFKSFFNGISSRPLTSIVTQYVPILTIYLFFPILFTIEVGLILLSFYSISLHFIHRYIYKTFFFYFIVNTLNFITYVRTHTFIQIMCISIISNVSVQFSYDFFFYLFNINYLNQCSIIFYLFEYYLIKI